MTFIPVSVSFGIFLMEKIHLYYKYSAFCCWKFLLFQFSILMLYHKKIFEIYSSFIGEDFLFFVFWRNEWILMTTIYNVEFSMFTGICNKKNIEFNRPARMNQSSFEFLGWFERCWTFVGFLSINQLIIRKKCKNDSIVSTPQIF